ncbi:unnamed protein product [Leuciscus chuanchicus]
MNTTADFQRGVPLREYGPEPMGLACYFRGDKVNPHTRETIMLNAEANNLFRPMGSGGISRMTQRAEEACTFTPTWSPELVQNEKTSELRERGAWSTSSEREGPRLKIHLKCCLHESLSRMTLEGEEADISYKTDPHSQTKAIKSRRPRAAGSQNQESQTAAGSGETPASGSNQNQNQNQDQDQDQDQDQNQNQKNTPEKLLTMI